MQVVEIIRQKILSKGPISFHDFMEMALYHPQYGYYTSRENIIGKKGDYYTSPYYTELLGEMIGKQLEEMWRILDKEAFTLVEYGAGAGTLCNDILTYLKSNDAFYKKFNYCIIEKSPAMLAKEINYLQENVYWFDSIEEIPFDVSCVLSNEVLDNFPVHKVVMSEELKEVFVDYQNGFIELLKPASGALKKYLNELYINLPQGYCTEINLAMLNWIESVANKLKKGFVLTIDYGSSSSELYSPEKSAGTLVCYDRHRVIDDPYSNIGNRDITSHVNFSALRYWGYKCGLEFCGFTNQVNFLLGIGLTEHLKKLELKKDAIVMKEGTTADFLQNFLLDIGKKFKVLIQHKGVHFNTSLSGLKFLLQLE